MNMVEKLQKKAHIPVFSVNLIIKLNYFCEFAGFREACASIIVLGAL